MPYADKEEGLKHRREYQKTPGGKEAHYRANQAYRKRNRQKQRAHNVIAKAVKSGKILPMPCLVCGIDSVEAHHPDYSAPLHVIWLCDAHHKEVHGMVK